MRMLPSAFLLLLQPSPELKSAMEDLRKDLEAYNALRGKYENLLDEYDVAKRRNDQDKMDALAKPLREEYDRLLRAKEAYKAKAAEHRRLADGEIQQKPDDIELREIRVELCRLLEDYSVATQDLVKITEANPTPGNFQRTAETAARAAEQATQEADEARRKRDVGTESAKRTEAAGFAETATANAGKVAEAEPTFEKLYWAAEICRRVQAADKAIEYAARALSKEAKLENLVWAAELAAKLQKAEAALEYSARVVAMDARAGNLMWASGIAAQVRKVDEAVAYLERCVKAEPKPEYLRWAAEQLQRLGRPDPALKCCRQLLEVDPSREQRIWVMDFALRLERFEVIQEIAEKMLAQDPKDAEGMLYRGIAFTLTSRFLQALEQYQAVATGFPEHPRVHEARFRWGNTLFCLNRFAEAADLYAAILRDFPGHPMTEQTKIQRDRFLQRAEFWRSELELRAAEEKADDLPRIKLVTSRGDIVLELFENEAPNTVANFVKLTEQKFFDGTKFHLARPARFIQGGCPNTRDEDPSNDGRGNPGYFIPDELPPEKFRRHFRGSVGMATSGPNTAGSQFYICLVPLDSADGRNVVFGRVFSGQEVADQLRKGDELIRAEVIRKRSHPYEPNVIPNR